MLPENQFHRRCCYPRHQVLDYLVAAGAVAVAGAAFLSSAFAVLLVAGFLASSLATTGASALVTAGVATGAAGLAAGAAGLAAGAAGLVASAAKAVTANRVIKVAISDFILISFDLEFMQELISCMYIQRGSPKLR